MTAAFGTDRKYSCLLRDGSIDEAREWKQTIEKDLPGKIFAYKDDKGSITIL